MGEGMFLEEYSTCLNDLLPNDTYIHPLENRNKTLTYQGKLLLTFIQRHLNDEVKDD